MIHLESFLDLDDSPRINTAWLHKDLNVSDLQAYVRLPPWPLESYSSDYHIEPYWR